jgi:hypothetical protein
LKPIRKLILRAHRRYQCVTSSLYTTNNNARESIEWSERGGPEAMRIRANISALACTTLPHLYLNPQLSPRTPLNCYTNNMSQNPDMRFRGAAAGPYGPNNPPPPPPGPLPRNSQSQRFAPERQGQSVASRQNQRFASEDQGQPSAKRGRLGKDRRKQAYEQRELEERVRSRSPARSQDRGGPARYRQRTPPRREQVQEQFPSAPAQREQRRPPTIQSGVCFICDQPGR